jgi:hypothetical protein
MGMRKKYKFESLELDRVIEEVSGKDDTKSAMCSQRFLVLDLNFELNVNEKGRTG